MFAVTRCLSQTLHLTDAIIIFSQVFGIEVEEIDVGKSRGYILVDGVKSEEQHELIDW